MCSGCGFEAMSCTRVSLFTKVTREPAGTVSVRGETPVDVIVNVVPPGLSGLASALGLVTAQQMARRHHLRRPRL